jgi:HK97 family phage portal protein
MRSPLAFLRERWQREPRPAAQPQLNFGGLPAWRANRPLPEPEDFRALLQMGYRRQAIIFACVREIAQSGAEPTLRLARGQGAEQQVLTTHPLLTLLQNPNGRQNGFEFLELLLTYLEAVGNSYIYKVRSAIGKVVALELLRPDRVRPIPGGKEEGGRVIAYEHRIEGSAEGDRLAPRDVIHFRLPDPMGDYYGLAPIAVAAAVADLDTNAVDFLRGFFLNDGTPAGLFTTKEVVGPEERQRIKETWRAEHQGMKGWHSVAVLDADVEYTKIGAEPGKLRMDAVFDSTEARLCMVWGVPPITIGTRLGLMASTYSNYQQAAESFWRETLKPTFRRVAAKLSSDLAAEFDPTLYLYFDLSTVEVLQEAKDTLRAASLEAWKTNGITRAELRRTLGYQSDPARDDVYFSDVAPPAPMPAGLALPEATEELGARLGLPAPEQHRDPHFKTLHAIADAASPKVRAAFLEAVARALNKTTLKKVEAALRQHDLEKAMAAVPWESQAVKALEAKLPLQLQGIAVAAANASAPAAGLDLSFAADAPFAVAFAAARSAQLVREVTEETRRALRKTIALAIQEGRPPGAAAREIRSAVGLTARQAGAVEAVRQRDGAEAAARFADKLRRRRAMNIARTETILAANSGQQALWEEGAAAGLLDQSKFKRVWITTPDDRLCPFCASLNGATVELTEQFNPGEVARSDGSPVTLNPVLVPPLHPSCRCAVGLVPV